MESDNRIKKRTGQEKTPKEIIERYANINYNNHTEEDVEKIRSFYAIKLEEIKKLKEENDFSNLCEMVESRLRKNQSLEVENYTSQMKNKTLEADFNKHKQENEDLGRKLVDKEKYGKMIVEKINKINSDKQKIISDESEKRNELVKQTENFVRSLQSKYEDELPEKKKIIEENSALRNEIENCIKNSGNLKEILENRLKEKEKISESMENKIKTDLKSKMESLSFNAQRYIFENSELKIQITNHKKKKEELMNLVNAFNQEYDKLKREVEKKKQDIILLSAENYDLQIKMKTHGFNKDAFEKAYKEYEKTNNQLNAMKKLNTKLVDQLKGLKPQEESSTPVDADSENK